MVEPDYRTIDTNNLHNIFLNTIYELAKEDDNKPLGYCKVFGKTAWGHMSPFLGKEQNEIMIRVDGIILSGNNLSRIWIKLYEYCYSISKETTYKYILPSLKGLSVIEDNPREFVLNFLENLCHPEYPDNEFVLFQVDLL